MNLYFMRHGETDWNRLRKIQGQADNPLNEAGRKEAIRSGKILSAIRFDKCYCSPLRRARETAEAVLSWQNCPVVYEKLIREISYGIDDGQSLDDIKCKETLPLHNYFAAPARYVPPKGGETIQDLQCRCSTFLEQVRLADGELDHVLAVCHGAFIRGIITVLNHMEAADFWTGREQKNCAVTAVHCENNRWTIQKEAVDILGGESLF